MLAAQMTQRHINATGKNLPDEAGVGNRKVQKGTTFFAIFSCSNINRRKLEACKIRLDPSKSDPWNF
jgi:hypothetical protein